MANTTKIWSVFNVSVSVSVVFAWLLSSCGLVLAKPLILDHFSFSLNNGRELSRQGRVLVEEKLIQVNTPISLMLGYEDKTVTFDNLYRAPICSLHQHLTVTTGEGSTTYDNYNCNTYVDSNYNAVLTVSPDGSIEGVVLIDGAPIHIRTGTGEESGSIVADIPDLGAFDCGFSELVNEQDNKNETGSGNGNDNGRKLSVERWRNCYPGDNEPNQFYIGVFIGSTLANRLGDDAAVMSWVEGIAAMANTIYARQLNIYLVVKHIVISDRSGTEPWDNPSCTLSISEQFDKFNDATRPSAQGLWHIFDDCYRSGQAIGLAYPSSLCTGSRISSGISFYSTNTWLTFAHEVGHNHGAQHSFEEGKGSTGGIMDYGDKTLHGEYQFNTKYRKKQVCAHITDTMSRCDAFRDPAIDPSKLGNGVIDLGEECDCEPGKRSCKCCQNGKLKAGSKCSPHGNECCNEECVFKAASNDAFCTMPNGDSGFCRNGQCSSGGCFRFNLEGFCSLWDDNPCKVKCKYGNSCTKMDGWTIGGEPINHVNDGTLCPRSKTEMGVCSAGACIAGSISGDPTDQEKSEVTHDNNDTVAKVASIAVVLVVGAGLACLILTVVNKRHKNRQRKNVIDVSCGPNDYNNEMPPPPNIHNYIGKPLSDPDTSFLRYPGVGHGKRSTNGNECEYVDVGVGVGVGVGAGVIEETKELSSTYWNEQMIHPPVARLPPVPPVPPVPPLFSKERKRDYPSNDEYMDKYVKQPPVPVPAAFNREPKWNNRTPNEEQLGSYATQSPVPPSFRRERKWSPASYIPSVGSGNHLGVVASVTPQSSSGRSNFSSSLQNEDSSYPRNEMKTAIKKERENLFNTASFSSSFAHDQSPRLKARKPGYVEKNITSDSGWTRFGRNGVKKSSHKTDDSSSVHLAAERGNNNVTRNLNGDTQEILTSSSFTSVREKFQGKPKRSSGSFGQTRAKFETANNRKPIYPPKQSSSRTKGMVAGGNGKSIYSYEELLREKDSGSSNLDRANLEQYLKPLEFVVLFGISRSQFDSMPLWKKNELKREANLF